MFAAILSVVFIYLLMGVLFESLMLPLSILVTIPLAEHRRGMWAHYHHGTGYRHPGRGRRGVLLIGVVVNNGIVLIDYLNRLRARGLSSVTRRCCKAAERRFRPIMMTALTTIFGMIPLTLGGASSIGWSYTSFGLTLIGGMSTATLLTLLVVPVFYTFFDDAREALMASLSRALRDRRSPAKVEL